MKNVKFRGMPRKKNNPAVNSADQIPREKPKFRGSARNSAARGKLWALIINEGATVDGVKLRVYRSPPPPPPQTHTHTFRACIGSSAPTCSVGSTNMKLWCFENQYVVHVATNDDLPLAVVFISLPVQHEELGLVRNGLYALHNLLVVLASDVGPVHLNDSVSLAQSGKVGRRPLVHLPDELAALALLGVQVEPIPGEVRSLPDVAQPRLRGVRRDIVIHGNEMTTNHWSFTRCPAPRCRLPLIECHSSLSGVLGPFVVDRSTYPMLSDRRPTIALAAGAERRRVDRTGYLHGGAHPQTLARDQRL